jgi:hypothetical protein
VTAQRSGTDTERGLRQSGKGGSHIGHRAEVISIPKGWS